MCESNNGIMNSAGMKITAKDNTFSRNNDNKNTNLLDEMM